MNGIRNIYLKMKTINDAKNIIFNYFKNIKINKSDKITSVESVGRILAEPVFAVISSPHFNAAAMDGIAVLAEKTFNASEVKPQELILNKETYYINTGQVIPKGTNSVIMIENIQKIGNNKIVIEKPAYPWQNVRKIGEDIVATELLFTRNHEITSYCLGALISAGVYEVVVKNKPKILVIPTGSELLNWENTNPKKLKEGTILESNSYVLENMINLLGGECIRHDFVLDDLKLIEKVILEASQTDIDMILTIGGSSSGSKDYALPILDKIGKVLVHGVTMMPGKPLIVGAINSKPFFGIPGYPISAIVSFEEFVQPLICHMLSISNFEREKINVISSRKIASKLGMDEFLRVKIGKIIDRFIAIPLSRGAGAITSITEADGIIRIPRDVEGIMPGESVEAELLKRSSNIKSNILIVGSHDNSLNILADELKRCNSKLTISSSHVGSIGGLIAVRNNLCHLAGSHLLDEKTGIYNISYIKKYLPNINIALINLVKREQGIIIAKGNPKKILGLQDLKRKDILFVNRQQGSGTRILLEYKLNELGILGTDIRGYSREEFTHMDVALAILNGSADLGVGIYAAANVFNLDFIPILTEKYDLIVRKEFLNSEKLLNLLEKINSKYFKIEVEKLGGYNTENTGEISFVTSKTIKS